MRTDALAPLFENPGPFATAYVDVSRDVDDPRGAADLSVRTATDQLRAAGAPEAVERSIAERLSRPTGLPAPTSRCVVADENGRILLDEVTRTARTTPYGAWGALPDLLPWIADVDASVPFVLALVDHEGGDVSVHRSGVHRAPESTEAGGETMYENKVAGGGWAHLKWQHTTENVWERNAQEVAARIRHRVTSEGIDLVLLAGEADSRAQVRNALSDVQDVTITEFDAGGRNADGGDAALAEAVERALDEVIGTRAVDRNEELAERLGRDDAVATGVNDVLNAFVAGQVERLLVDPDGVADLEIEPSRYPGLAFGAVTDVPERLSAGPVLVAAATLTGAAIEAMPRALQFDAPVSALLRWNAPPAEGVNR
ncbi:Vms1/Ankzf1 family peptidyl-tRNA hydrolase [uncultured Aeromicrobium sp.]|uniref:baeRF2 domain-containing protein n=1 Tax=uncultured Aeromicrobium sp. TaxID=337820 RepID=UPI0025D98546|nr:Vms1/Ankzf1 family peptidyl-tRNA hydrolase [uncultured Aeromicrobium sp.]